MLLPFVAISILFVYTEADSIPFSLQKLNKGVDLLKTLSAICLICLLLISLVSSNAEISVSFKFNNLKTTTNINFEKITFPVYNLKEAYIKNYQSLTLGECFNYFSVDDILKIFRYMVLEIPLLFFSTDKGALSLFVDNFLFLLNPFVYKFRTKIYFWN